MAAAAVCANLAVLLYFKYTGFLMANANAWFGLSMAVPVILLPLGVSFITFQKIAYIVDVYRGQARDRGLLKFAFSSASSRSLIAGPIAHHAEIIPQLDRGLSRGRALRGRGLSLFALGLFKKVALADGVAGFGSRLDVAATAASAALSAWAGALAYTMQIYFDFSGYSDMACGPLYVRHRMPLTSSRPNKAASIIEFWRRLHMTLSRFPRD